MDDSQQFTRSAGMVSEHVVPLEGDCTMHCGPAAAKSMGAERPVFVVPLSQWSVAHLRDGSRTTPSQRMDAKLRELAELAVQLSLFPEPSQSEYECASLHHVRCPDCRAVNDVPSLPTICYACRRALREEERW